MPSAIFTLGDTNTLVCRYPIEYVEALVWLGLHVGSSSVPLQQVAVSRNHEDELVAMRGWLFALAFPGRLAKTTKRTVSPPGCGSVTVYLSG